MHGGATFVRLSVEYDVLSRLIDHMDILGYSSEIKRRKVDGTSKTADIWRVWAGNAGE